LHEKSIVFVTTRYNGSMFVKSRLCVCPSFPYLVNYAVCIRIRKETSTDGWAKERTQPSTVFHVMCKWLLPYVVCLKNWRKRLICHSSPKLKKNSLKKTYFSWQGLRDESYPVFWTSRTIDFFYTYKFNIVQTNSMIYFRNVSN